jgi:hypothetical protein
MDLSVNRKTLTPEDRQKKIIEGQYQYSGGFGYMAWASSNKYTYRHQLHVNEAHLAPFQFNVSTAQTAPMVVNTQTAYLAPPSCTLVKKLDVPSADNGIHMGLTCSLHAFCLSGFAIVDPNEMDGNYLIVMCTLHK